MIKKNKIEEVTQRANELRITEWNRIRDERKSAQLMLLKSYIMIKKYSRKRTINRCTVYTSTILKMKKKSSKEKEWDYIRT